MKITDVKTHLLAIPLDQRELKTPWFWGNFNQIIVAIRTDEGITGYGEAFGYGVPEATVSVINDLLRPALIGKDPTRISDIQENLYKRTHLFGRDGITIFAISGIDIALWDIAGKAAGLPLYRLFGGAKKDRVAAYASLVRYADADALLIAVQHALNAGYKAIKLHQLDIESLRIARETAGDSVKLMMDVNCAWTRTQALRMAREFKAYDIAWLEEPLWPPEDFNGLSGLRREAQVPIALGENACLAHQFHRMLEACAADYVQPSVIKVGGVSEWRKVAALAETYHVSMAPHSPYFGPGFLATAHLIAATPCAEWLECMYLQLESGIFRDSPPIENGLFPLPQGPGIGLEIDEETLARYSRSSIKS